MLMPFNFTAVKVNSIQQQHDLEQARSGYVASDTLTVESKTPNRSWRWSLTGCMRQHGKPALHNIYGQLFSVVALGNLSAAVAVTVRYWRLNDRNQALMLQSDSITATFANITFAVLIRQPYVKNLLFAACWSMPHGVPIWIRRRFAMVYEMGGMHSSAAVCSVLWLIMFAVVLSSRYLQHLYTDGATLVLLYSVLLLLIVICIGAIPSLRRRYHDMFENTHRLGGWLAVALAWPILILLAVSETSLSNPQTALGTALAQSPPFWLLMVTTFNVVYPWLFLRKVHVVKVELFDDRAVRIYFDPQEHISPLRTVAISDRPLKEWHSFAAIPDSDDPKASASIIVSNAGDWTARTVMAPRSYYWMRGFHPTGMIFLARMFKSVVIMATGSGIAPCLGVFDYLPFTLVRVIWSASRPQEIFGNKIYSAVLRADSRATICDTHMQQRPDLVQLALNTYWEAGAEAVFFISNRGLTRKIIGALRRKGVCALAPNFDS